MNQDNIINLSPDGVDINIASGAEDIFIGENCHNISINAKCKWIHIGDNCSGIKVVDSMYVEMYDNNQDVTLEGAIGTRVGYGNLSVSEVDSRGVLVERDCKGLSLVRADGNSINRSTNLTIKSKNNLIEDSTGIVTDVNSMYTEVKRSGDLDIKKSLSTKSDKSQLVAVDRSDNTFVQASDLNVTLQRPFRSYITKDNKMTVCKLDGDLSEYNVDRSNGDIKMVGVNNLLDCPADDDGIYARYKGQWINIDTLMTGPKDPNNVYARYNGEWVVVKAVDPTLPPPDPPKATNSIDPDSIHPQNPADYITKQ